MPGRVFEVDGANVTVLVTDVPDGVQLGALGESDFYQANHDSDGDGELDSVIATFGLSPDRFGTQYGIRIVVDDAPDITIAVVDHYTGYPGPVRHSGSYSGDATYLYLGSAFRDKVLAGNIDTVYGYDGNDILRSSGALDGTELIGGTGNDQLIGSLRRDTLVGESGRDTMTGGGGADVFVFDAAALDKRDIVTDFSQAENDRVDLSAIAGLDFVAAFTGTGPEVRERQLADRTALIFDLDGNGTEDARITFFGAIDFGRSDLILPA